MTANIQIVADIGGTNARFACAAAGSNTLEHIQTLQCADHPGIEQALRTYLAEIGMSPANLAAVCLAIAGPVEQDLIRLTNNPWTFSRTQLASALGCNVYIINDFFAQASCLSVVGADELQWWGAPRPGGGRVRVVLGPGTGLGVAGISGDGEIMPTEGGHIAFAPANKHELQVLELLWKQFERVSVERLLSGPGLSTLFEANATLADKSVEPADPAAITQRAQQGDALCLQTIRDFLDILANVAGDYALGMGARDGVYLTGGILPKLGTLLDRARFRQRFEAKGRMQPYCANTPLALITAENTGLRGSLAALRRIERTIQRT
jgi:glucokinase